jgi:hypothetical protein
VPSRQRWGCARAARLRDCVRTRLDLSAGHAQTAPAPAAEAGPRVLCADGSGGLVQELSECNLNDRELTPGRLATRAITGCRWRLNEGAMALCEATS